MEQFFTSIQAAQLGFLILIIVPLVVCWYLSKPYAAICLGIVTATVSFSCLMLPAELDSIHMQSWFLSLVKLISDVDPLLTESSQNIASWLSFGLGAGLSWILLIIWASVMRDSRSVVRGTDLLVEDKMWRQLRRYGKPRVPACMGQFYVPYSLETRSLALFGEPGSGKTQLILRLLVSLRRRNDRVVTMDVGGDLYRKLVTKGDRLLSATAEGGQEWSPFAEIKNTNDCNTIANALIPSGLGESHIWNGYARELLTVFLRVCWEQNRRTNQQLLHYVRVATNEELRVLVSGSSVQRLFEQGSEKMLSNVQSILSQHLSPLDLLEPSAGEHSFSLREWVGSRSDKGWLWISYDDLTAAATAPLRAAWVEILTRSVLNLEPNEERRIWLSLDELASNGKIDVLSQAIARGRKYGLSLILGVQNISQLYSIYGRDKATSIIGSVGHMVVLRTPDADTSDYLSRTIGESETVREQVSVSSQGGSTTQKVREIKRAVLPSEISKLPDLSGYIKIAGVGWSKLNVPLVKLKHRLSIKTKEEPSPDILNHGGHPSTEDSGNSAIHSSLDDI